MPPTFSIANVTKRCAAQSQAKSRVYAQWAVGAKLAHRLL
jgi:hypothetical protein